jgi:hypothetical protein
VPIYVIATRFSTRDVFVAAPIFGMVSLNSGVQDARVPFGKCALAGHHSGTLVSRKVATHNSSCSTATGILESII